MTDGLTEKLQATRRRLWRKQHGKCAACEGLIPVHALGTWDCQLAHVLPQDKVMLRLYGAAVIHHDDNLRLVCSDRCNSAVSKRNHPLWEREHVAAIKAKLGRE